ncbi:hypothetical protein KTJ16_00460 [Acinetobacter bereziniae]|uniref:hypothetical protein n=1 Tax=Acinetobacter bereziniae TaxID=106648 RepID=UPI0021CD9049|nr:hypothetical protein [Acinetobacter bereziniae]MCU4539651.1 hypothetical protein [Acinetobacter bereziniae]MCU4624170.1 hypothetical protein [Acinetobacter bereziniae]
MYSKSKVAIENIGPESLYVIEKTGSAIYKDPGIDTNLAKDYLKPYKEGFQKLKAEIDKSDVYDNSYYDYEFDTLFYAIDKLYLALGNINSEEEILEARIFHIHMSRQDDKIRRSMEESEQN